MIFSERNWNMWIPGFGAEELKPYKKATTTEAHKQVGEHNNTGYNTFPTILDSCHLLCTLIAYI